MAQSPAHTDPNIFRTLHTYVANPCAAAGVRHLRSECSGISYNACPAATARNSAWQFINKTNDPRLSVLRKFGEAVRVKVSGLLRD